MDKWAALAEKWAAEMEIAARAFGDNHPVLLAMDEVMCALVDRDLNAWAKAVHDVYAARRASKPSRAEVAA